MAETMTTEEMRAEIAAMDACEDCEAVQDAMRALGKLSKCGLLTAVEYLRASGDVSDAQIRHEEAKHPKWRAEVLAIVAKGVTVRG